MVSVNIVVSYKLPITRDTTVINVSIYYFVRMLRFVIHVYF